jgi:hypothetical protein
MEVPMNAGAAAPPRAPGTQDAVPVAERVFGPAGRPALHHVSL